MMRQGACLPALFEEQARRTPSAVAVELGRDKLSYRELNARANQVAHELRSRGVGPEFIVGICLHHSFQMLAGLLGILKAGGAYLPLDPTYPRERLAIFLEDASPRIILVAPDTQGCLPPHSSEVIVLESDWGRLQDGEASDLDVGLGPGHLAYVPYTSGSTGRPKGAEICHGALVNFLGSMRRAPGLEPEDRFLALMPLSFDISVLELFLPLTVGATVVLGDRSALYDDDRLLSVVRNSRATVMQGAPYNWSSLLRADWKGDPGLKMLTGCEAMPPEHAARLARLGRSLWNLYGLTELAVWSTVYRYEGRPGPLPIGKPIDHTYVRILDSNHQPVADGDVGELHIGGTGLGRGYLNSPELTAAKYIPDPFSPEPGARMFKTGDEARLLPDGNIEFLGRRDFQIKYRGFRVEPGDIEAALAQHPGVVAGAAALVKSSDGEAALTAFVVPRGAEPIERSLHSFMLQKLPDFMLPEKYVFLPRLPLTPSGKVDRRLLATGSVVSIPPTAA
ncbi:MAG: amino acid adenylation domain-containing protein [Elusimicrobiota bacterium]